MPQDRAYRAYLVRCWQEGPSIPNDQPIWRFAVEEVLHERRLRGFHSLEALVAFLRSELADSKKEPADE